MEQSAPIYNSRITKVYLEYLKSAYPEVDQEEILAVAGMKRYKVEEPFPFAHFRNRWTDFTMLLWSTQGTRVFPEAGRYATSAKGIGPIHSNMHCVC